MREAVMAASLVTQLARAHADYERAKDKLESLKALARAQLKMGDNNVGSNHVILSPNRTWNKAKARENYGDAICSMQVDTKKAKEVMTGAEYDSYYIEGAPRVTVKIDD